MEQIKCTRQVYIDYVACVYMSIFTKHLFISKLLRSQLLLEIELVQGVWRFQYAYAFEYVATSYLHVAILFDML